MVRDILENLSKKTRIVIVIAILASLLLFTLAPKKIANDNTDGEYQAPNVPAFITYKDSPYSVTGSPASEGFLKTDLALFARTIYPQYNKDNRIPVEFIVDKILKNTDSPIVINGKYKNTNNNITIEVETLKNDRIKLSIVDTETDTNINTSLESNSSENQFIGTLPINQEYYGVSYEPPNVVSITAYFRDPTILAEANAKIESIVGAETMKQLNISISYPTAGFMDE